MTNPNRMLIIDGEEAIQQTLYDIAEEAGFVVKVANGQVQVSVLLARFEPSVMLINLIKPSMDSIELLRQLAKRHCEVPIVLLGDEDSRVLKTVVRIGTGLGLAMHESVFGLPVDSTGFYQALVELKSDEMVDDGWRPSLRTLARALVNKDIVSHFQPKVDLQANGFPIVGGEALARWIHPVHGLLPPSRFLPVAEEVKFMPRISAAMLASVTTHLADWSQRGVAVPISINISPRELTDPDLPRRLIDGLAAKNIAPELLTVEITEQAAMDDLEVAADILARLRLSNISVSLDDFGTGYSSLVELYRLPLNELKLDRSLIGDLVSDKSAHTVAQTMIEMAGSLGMTVCAEGVEDVDTARILQDMGCGLAQGFFFGKPLPAVEFEAQLVARTHRFFRQHTHAYTRLDDETVSDETGAEEARGFVV